MTRGVPFLLRRFGRFVLSLWALVTVGFLLVHLIPGDPARASLGLFAPKELVDARRHALGLDAPLQQQYAHYLGGVAKGDFGVSMATQEPVGQLIGERLPNTLTLATLSLALVLVFGVTLGILVAALTCGGRRSGLDTAFNAATGFLAAMPEFVSAVMLTAAFAVFLRWFPIAGNSGIASYFLPVLALAIGPMAVMSRIVRVEALRVLREDYMRTARAKRLGNVRLYLVHVLPNCLTATLTVSGLVLGALVAGTVLIESVFAWPGIGSLIVLAITQKDYPLTQGVILVLGVIVLSINLAVDLLISMLDPRSTLARA